MKLNHRGMTLIELIAAIFIITIASIMLVTGFSATTKVIQESNQYKNATNNQFAVLTKQIEKDTVSIEEQETKMIITIDGKQIESKGVLQVANSANFKGVSLQYFTMKKSKTNPYQEYYYQTLDLFNTIKAMTKEQGQAYLEELEKQSGITTNYTYSGWLQNDDFHVFAYLANGFLEIDHQIIEECNAIYDTSHIPSVSWSQEAKARFGDKKLYLKPYRIEIGNQGEEALVMMAVTSNDLSNDQWRTSLLYNPVDRSWYYKVFPSGSEEGIFLQVSALKNDGVTWTILQAQLQDPTQWQKLNYQSDK